MKKSPKVVLTSELLGKQTQAFLESGGEIQYIKPGVTGYNSIPKVKPAIYDKAK